MKGHFATHQQGVQECWYLKQLLSYNKTKTLSLKKAFAHPAETPAIQARRPKSFSLKLLPSKYKAGRKKHTKSLFFVYMFVSFFFGQGRGECYKLLYGIRREGRNKVPTKIQNIVRGTMNFQQRLS